MDRHRERSRNITPQKEVFSEFFASRQRLIPLLSDRCSDQRTTLGTIRTLVAAVLFVNKQYGDLIRGTV